MDAQTIWAAIGCSLTAAGMAGTVMARATFYFVRREARDIAREEAEKAASEIWRDTQSLVQMIRHEIETVIDLKLAEQTDTIMQRVNGSYMRSPEQRSVNDSLAKSIDELRREMAYQRTTLDKLHLDFSHMTASIGRIRAEEAAAERRAAAGGGL